MAILNLICRASGGHRGLKLGLLPTIEVLFDILEFGENRSDL